MLRRSLGLTMIGYGLLFVCALWLIAYFIALITSLFNTKAIMSSGAIGDTFRNIGEFQINALVFWLFYSVQLAGFIAVLNLREWGRKLIITINAVICGYILSRSIFTIGRIDLLTVFTLTAYVGVIIFFCVPRIKRQFLSISPGSGNRILIVDDDKGFLKMARKQLSQKGLDVITALTGEQGLRTARKMQPNLIILDVILPGIKGREVCERLKKDPLTMDIPVMFLTAKDSPDDVRAEIEAGAVTHVTKPFDTERIMTEIKKILGA